MNIKNSCITFMLASQLLALSELASYASGNEKGFYSVVPMATMEDPRRLEWQKPAKVIDYLLLKPGDVVADIGAGTGYFTVLFADRVGKQGKVYAVDVDEEMTRHMSKRVNQCGLDNVKIVLAPTDDPLLPKASSDLIFLCDAYIFIENRITYLTRLSESLKSAGRLAIVSFNMKNEIPGAPPLRKRIPKALIMQEVESAGFVMEAEYFFLPYQFFLVFTKK